MSYEQEILGVDTRMYVRNTEKEPFRYICNLEYDHPDYGVIASCTGTLIGPRTVLTAGHCIEDADPAKMRVIPGRNGTLEPLAASVAKAFVLYPKMTEGARTDLGIIHLADPIGDTVGYWSSLLPGELPKPAGKLWVNMSGYPLDLPRKKSLQCRDPYATGRGCRQSHLADKLRSRLCGTYQYKTWGRTVRQTKSFLYYLNDTCLGQSGSPVWVKRHPSMGGHVLIGVNVGSGEQENGAIVIQGPVRKFIVDNIQ